MNLLTVREVAGMLKLSASKVYELIARGKIPVYKVGGALRIGRHDLEAYLNACREVRGTVKTKLRYLHLSSPS